MVRTRLAVACGLWLGVFRAATASDLEPCQTKPNWSNTSCPAGSAVACWSSTEGTSWECWSAAWAPAWSVTSKGFSAFTANAMCQSKPVVGFPGNYYDGACKLSDADGGSRRVEPPSFLSWDLAYVKARKTLGKMTNEQKGKLMLGKGWHKTKTFFELDNWWYVGNTEGIPELGIPSLNMQDAADGFRTYWNDLVGTVTTWPSLLALAATWDESAVKALGVALGEEFVGKGANTILGPSINVHRGARNGRNFEYLSGEDPYLGSRLVVPYIEGVHSQGVLAVMKHYIMNEQETNRDKESSNVDEKTSWELYYPPFQAAVDAGVDAAMCSYNKIDGVYSCENSKTLSDLKDKMGFRGFVQSDWWATHSTSVDKGLDQEMPGIDLDNKEHPDKNPYFFLGYLEQKGQHYIDAASERILAAMYRARLDVTTQCSPPDCKDFFLRNMTSTAHVALSRSLATQSIVLLKNEDSVLPLSYENVKSIAVIGPAADAKAYNPAGAGQDGGSIWNKGDYYSGGGSGHMVSETGSLVSALKGIKTMAAQRNIEVLQSLSNDTAQAKLVAEEVDVTIIVGGATCGEAMDRPDLKLEDGMDALIEEVAASAKALGKKVVVLLQIPGALVMPWKDEVSAIAAMFLGGQETGNAWGSVIFGEHNPTGRLPITMPQSEEDTIDIGEGLDVDYSEKLATGYRNGKKPAFAFGYGLSYTAFEYGDPVNVTCGEGGKKAFVACVEIEVTNVGQVPGQTVAQLYLEFPAAAGYPTHVLKGFEKTGVLRPTQGSKVKFGLTGRDVSYFEAASKTWVRVPSVKAKIGESFVDIKKTLDLQLPMPVAQKPRDWTSFVIVAAAVVAALAIVAGCVCFSQKKESARDFYTSSDEE